MSIIKRPGGELANRPLHFFWIVDCSGSMVGEKIESVNYAIRDTIKPMREAADDNPNAQVLIRTLKFSTDAQWINVTPINIADFEWDDLDANGVTDMGKALEMVAEQLKIPPMSERALPPILVLLSDGQPTDDYRRGLNALRTLPWGKKAVKIAIAIGSDADKNVLKEYSEHVFEAKNSTALVELIKWASTLVNQVSDPSSNIEGNGPVQINTSTIPQPDTDDTNAEDVW